MVKKVYQNILFVSIFAGFLASCNAADVFADAEIQVTANVEESISLSVSDASKSITFSSVSGSGSFGYTSFSVGASLNVPRRYQISMYSSSSASDATSLSSSSSTIPTLSSTESSVTLTTGAGWTSRNTWGYAIGNSGSLDFNAVGSSSAASILHNYSDSTAAIINNASTNVTLGAMVDMNSASGTYTTTLNFVMVAELLYDYNLIFDANGGSGAPATMTSTGNSSTYHNFTIPSVTPVSPDNSIEFLGWSTDPDATTATYANGDTYTMNASSYITTGKLYAVYGATTTFVQAYAAAGKSQTSGYYAMQDMTSDICAAVTSGQSESLIDTRSGNEVYLVAKLADNKCWMLDNLRLGGSSAITLTSSDSNVSSSYILAASGSWSSSTQPNYTTGHINSSYKNTTTTSYGSGSGKIGVYYNYCAVSAGTYCYDSTSGIGNAQYDICPKGWRLPTGGSSGEYVTVYSAYGGNRTSLSSALSLLFSGYIDSQGEGVVTSQGSCGYFWSSTYQNVQNMYKVSFGQWNFSTGTGDYRSYGESVRCVSK